VALRKQSYFGGFVSSFLSIFTEERSGQKQKRKQKAKSKKQKAKSKKAKAKAKAKTIRLKQ